MDLQNSQIKPISQLIVAGYKSISREQRIDIHPLTILAGANSSGKSSIMQPLLLLKQTLEATYDPGPLLLNGPNVKFTAADQLLSSIGRGKQSRLFQFGFGVEGFPSLTYDFQYLPKSGFALRQMRIFQDDQHVTFNLDMTPQEVKQTFIDSFLANQLFASPDDPITVLARPTDVSVMAFDIVVIRNRCLLDIVLQNIQMEVSREITLPILPIHTIRQNLQRLIHLPGLRGNPERTYPVTAVGPSFPGTFEAYVASVITHWQTTKDETRIASLGSYLEHLGLTWKVTAQAINDTQVELRVGRLPRPVRGGARDLVSIADVGVGVSQTLPILVALLVAEPGQIVYIEQPEIHLHPRAQTALAEVLADAARRGVRVITETHSSLLILGIQTLIAEGRLDPALVKLHWFQRGADGVTTIASTDLDEAGAFGEWPVDFADVTLEAESRYLDAAEALQVED